MDIDGIAAGIARQGKPVEKLVIQEVGGTIKTVEKATTIARQMVSDASRVLRQEFDDTKLMYGAECGGSDTTSGLGGNPAIGAAFDILVKKGGRAVFSETTEFIGAEHLLARRAVTPEVGDQITWFVRRYEERFLERGVDMRGTNPTKGNIQGGLTTIEEKSLGCIHKAGSAPIQGVLGYAEAPPGAGLYVMDTPGMDVESMAGLAAGGVQVMVFTTGRGTPTGNPIMPVIKVTANRRTADRMADNIDLDLSGVIEGTLSIEEAGGRILDEILAVAGGKLTKAEQLGHTEFSIYRVGPTF